MKHLFLVLALASISCGQNSSKKDETEHRKKELELKEKELGKKQNEIDSLKAIIFKPEENTIPLQKNETNDEISVESFGRLPETITTMNTVRESCDYSRTKGGERIFVSDEDEDAIMKINNKFVELKWVNNKTILRVGDPMKYINKDFEIILKITKESDDYNNGNEGILTIKSKKGKIQKIKIWGGCGH